METLSAIHSYWRYAVLIAAVLAIVAAGAAWLGPMMTRLIVSPVVRRVSVLYIIVMDVQVVIGIVLWLGKGGMAQAPPYRLEHPLTMILAAVAAHVGQVLAKRAKSGTAAARAITIAVVVSLVFVILGIPGLVRGG